MEVKLKAKVVDTNYPTIDLEFGRTQCDMQFSSTGTLARKLRLKKGDKVEVIIKKI